MIVVWVNKRDWRHPGPIVNVALQNARSFAEIGLETHLCLGRGDASDTRTDLSNFYGVSAHPLLNIHRIKRWPLAGSQSIFGAASLLVQHLAKKDRVAVLTREPGFLPGLAALCMNENVRGFYEPHDFHADPTWRESGLDWNDLREGWLERQFLPHISGLVCITTAQHRLYQALFPTLPMMSASLGTRPRVSVEPGRRRAKRTVAYVGHLHTSKGVLVLLKIARKLQHEAVKMIFWGGSPEQVGRFLRVAEEKDVSGSVQFMGFRPPQELDHALSQETSLGFVTLQDTYYNRYLTCPAKALDYLSHGLPVIASDLPSNREVLGDAALYVPPNEFVPARLAIRSLLDHPENFARYAHQAEQRAQLLAWPNRAKKITSFVEALF